MKKIFIILCASIFTISSCDQENLSTIYEPESPYVAFSSPVVSENVLSAENDFSVNVQIVRSELSVPVTAAISLEMNESIEGVFALESNTVTFEEGKGTAYAKIIPVIDPSLIDPTKTYTFQMTLNGDNVSELYNTATYKASFQFTPVGTGVFASIFFSESTEPEEWPVEVEKLEVGDLTLYKLKGLYESGYDITIITEGGNVTVNDQPAWYYDAEYGDVYITGNGSINGKTITMNLTHFIPDVYAWDPETEVLTLP